MAQCSDLLFCGHVWLDYAFNNKFIGVQSMLGMILCTSDQMQDLVTPELKFFEECTAVLMFR